FQVNGQGKRTCQAAAFFIACRYTCGAMNTKLQQWGLTLVVFGAASLGLPMVGVQLRIFNLFGQNQKAAGVAAIVVGGVMWLIGAGSRGLAGSSARTASPAVAAATAGVPPPVSGNRTCPKCGATATPGDRFCM